jgi:hypothetical protein
MLAFNVSLAGHPLPVQVLLLVLGNIYEIPQQECIHSYRYSLDSALIFL